MVALSISFYKYTKSVLVLIAILYEYQLKEKWHGWQPFWRVSAYSEIKVVKGFSD